MANKNKPLAPTQAVARRRRYTPDRCSRETRELATRLVDGLTGPNGHAIYQDMLAVGGGHAAKHISQSGPELLDDLLYNRIGSRFADRNHVNGFQDEESAEYDIVDAISVCRYEIAAWLNGEHEVPANRRLEIYVPDALSRDDLDDPDCESLAGPAFVRSGDDICLTRSAGIHLILDPREYDKNSFTIRTAYPDVTPGVSAPVPADLTEIVKTTEYYKNGDAFTKSVLEYMAADKPADRPSAFLTNDKSTFVVRLGRGDDEPALGVYNDGTVRLMPRRSEMYAGKKTRVVDTKDADVAAALRRTFPREFAVATALQDRIDDLNLYNRAARVTPTRQNPRSAADDLARQIERYGSTPVPTATDPGRAHAGLGS